MAFTLRIGEKAPLAPGLDGLSSLHRAHCAAVPFENLDILLGRPIALDLPALEAKLVRARRGGYCFEQNTLFRAALEALGSASLPSPPACAWARPRSGRARTCCSGPSSRRVPSWRT